MDITLELQCNILWSNQCSWTEGSAFCLIPWNTGGNSVSSSAQQACQFWHQHHTWTQQLTRRLRHSEVFSDGQRAVGAYANEKRRRKIARSSLQTDARILAHLAGGHWVHLREREARRITSNHIHHSHPQTQDICMVIKNAELQAARPGSLGKKVPISVVICRFWTERGQDQ